MYLSASGALLNGWVSTFGCVLDEFGGGADQDSLL